MKLLLDTHALLWFIEGDVRFPKKSRELIDDKKNACFVSIVSIWELAVKWKIGKIELAEPPSAFEQKISTLSMSMLNIQFEDIKVQESLPLIHRDPFDRILISRQSPTT